MTTISHIRITPDSVTLNGESLEPMPVAQLYRKYAGDYPKFFKMDALCKLGFVAAEILLKDIDPAQKEDAAIVLFNRNGSLITDRNYQATIGPADYFPSPAIFVYTLANIVTGEIAIRHKIYGESSFYVLPSPQPAVMDDIVRQTLLTSSPSLILTGWVDYDSPDAYLADLRLIRPS